MAGVIIRAGDMVIDGSVRGRLEKVRPLQRGGAAQFHQSQLERQALLGSM